MVLVVALKVPVVAPAATVIDAGTVSTVLLLVSVTAAPPVGAACVNVTVQVLDAFCPKLVGLQAKDDTVTGATRLTVAFAELLLYVAVTVALWLLAMVLVVALKVPVVAPAATVIDAGTVSTVLLLVSVTAAPPVGAACVNVTVQVLDAFCPKLVGLHASDDTVTGATRLTVALAELLLYVAVTVALWLLAMVLVVALKVPVVAPAATVIDAGTVSTVLLLVSVTAAPPVGAACVNVTVQVLDAFCPKLVGLHAKDDTVTGATRLTVALAELLLYVAVTVALWLLAMVLVVALKVPVVAPAATVIDAGTVSTVLLLVSVTAAPPVGAACVRVTVQVLDAFCPRLVGLHARTRPSQAPPGSPWRWPNCCCTSP